MFIDVLDNTYMIPTYMILKLGGHIPGNHNPLQSSSLGVL